MTDPFEVLAMPPERQAPRPAFARALRARLVAELGLAPAAHLPTVDLPRRSPAMSTSGPIAATALVPYLAVRGGAAAVDWYVEALGAVETLRVEMPDGRLGHAELRIGSTVLYLCDEFPEYGVSAPPTLGGFSTTLHLTVPAVDEVFARAVAAGATAVAEPADQPHGNRHGAVVDPFGHRWMLSQVLEDLDVAAYAARVADEGVTVAGEGPGHRVASADRPGTGGGIWASVHYADALAGIRQLVEVFGFEEQLVVTDDDGTTVVHAELRWPEGGLVSPMTYSAESVYARPPGTQALYVVTADPLAVWERARAAGLEVVRPPTEPDHDPGGTGFGVRDLEGNIWSFGTYGGAP